MAVATPSGGCSGHENLNVRAAYLHALGDFLQSLGVCIAGGVIWYNPSWQLCDPIVTLLFSVIVGATTIGICKTSLLVLMEGTSLDVDMAAVEAEIRSVATVTNLHDLRVWSISTGSLAITVHVVVAGAKDAVVAKLQARLLALHAFECMTIQVESEADAIRCPFNEKEATCMV
ncbi:Cation Diffusion Facilitator (CDF) Family [Achlya hypogyna]|uniref:Cation Diffusion Facilitator (CDF) Family n=1 Tax=Achlya hypogyna TaxID=1202772 RepID=A0A1V9Z9U8_ACHHY|nr:Cation Diffusion Facilitator (CDF) Family [Achlya hypogyna]